MTERILDEKQQIIADNIRKYRVQKGLKQEDVAGGLCSVSQFSKMENGKTPIKPEMLKEFAKRLGVSVDQLQVVDEMKQELVEELEMARNAISINQLDAAVEYARSVIKKGKAHGYSELVIDAIFAESQALCYSSRFFEIIERMEHELFVERTPLSPLHFVRMYLELAHMHVRVGNVERARVLHRIAEDYYQTQQWDQISLGKAMSVASWLASAHIDMHNYRTALPYVREAKRLAIQIDQLDWKYHIMTNEAIILVKLGELKQAEALYLETLEGVRKLSMIVYVATVQNNLGSVYLKNRELGEARVYFQRALKNYELMNDVDGQCAAILNLAEVALLNDNVPMLMDYLNEASELIEAKTVAMKHHSRKHELLSRLYRSQGDFERGVEELDRALNVYEEHFAFYEAYDMACQLAELLYEQGDPRATKYYRKAVNFDQRLGPIW